MRPSPPWRAWARRLLAIGPPRLALAGAILLLLASLALPFWSLGRVTGTDQDISSFSWTTITTDRYRDGAWDGTTILPYTSSQAVLAQLTFRAVGDALGSAYLLDVVVIVLFAAVFVLYSLGYSRTMPTLSLLILGLIVIALGLVALFYPIVAIPAAAATDVDTFAIGGFWGSASTAGPPAAWSWGPGLGWWVLLVAVVLGIAGAVLPYLMRIRGNVPPAPPGWRPSR